MTSVSDEQVAIIRTERGLTITGTRISLDDVIDLLKAHYPPKLIRDTFNLTDAQMNGALSYIEANRVQIEAEYQEVLQTREEIPKSATENTDTQLSIAHKSADPMAGELFSA
jgi:uncharacterized protein (DUF433 family)